MLSTIRHLSFWHLTWTAKHRTVLTNVEVQSLSSPARTKRNLTLQRETIEHRTLIVELRFANQTYETRPKEKNCNEYSPIKKSNKL